MLDKSTDVISFAKNYLAVNFRLDYQKVDGEIAHYIPDFFVKTDNKTIYIVETKGIETLNDHKKFNRLCDWCTDVNKAQSKYTYTPLYIKEEAFKKYQNDIATFTDLLNIGTSEKIHS